MDLAILDGGARAADHEVRRSTLWMRLRDRRAPLAVIALAYGVVARIALGRRMHAQG